MTVADLHLLVGIHFIPSPRRRRRRRNTGDATSSLSIMRLLRNTRASFLNSKLPLSGEAMFPSSPVPSFVSGYHSLPETERPVDASGKRSYECREGREDSAMPFPFKPHVPRPAKTSCAWASGD